ncbi:DUF2804 domain-containing protein [bacterium]|nr:DUF2804 domain-containing protein [bacterium]
MQTLVQADGRPPFGQFEATPQHINWRDADYRNLMGRPLPAWRRRLAFKQFEYFGLVSDDLIAGCALANLQFVGAAFVYAFRPSDGAMHNLSVRAPLARGMALTDQPMAGSSVLDTRKLKVQLDYADGSKRLRVESHSGLNIDASFDDTPQACDPMSLCTQAGRNGWVYARKIAGVAATGSVSSRLGNVDLQRAGAFAHHDYSAGFMRRETYWNWACLSGRAASGQRVGLNVSCGVNETSASENCCWIDGQRYALPGALFDYSRDDLDAPWRVRSADGAIDLQFQPLGRHTERLNAWLMATDFRQDFGHFSGWLRPASGPAIDITGLLGFCEDQFARW